MGLFKRLMGRLGYVKLAEYGLELTEDGVVPVPDDDEVVEGEFAVGSIANGSPVPDSPVLRPLDQSPTERFNVGDADTLTDEAPRTTGVKFLEADTIPAKKI